MFEKETEFFNKNKAKFRKEFLGKHVVISGNELLGVYNSDEEAYFEALKTKEPGEFMIKLITPTDEETIQRFTSLVYV